MLKNVSKTLKKVKFESVVLLWQWVI